MRAVFLAGFILAVCGCGESPPPETGGMPQKPVYRAKPPQKEAQTPPASKNNAASGQKKTDSPKGLGKSSSLSGGTEPAVDPSADRTRLSITQACEQKLDVIQKEHRSDFKDAAREIGEK